MKKWKPKVGEKYWFIHISGCHVHVLNYEAGYAGNYEVNVYRTKKEAESARMKIIKVLKGDAR